MQTQILESASKIVLLTITAALVVGLFIGKIDQETFKIMATMVFVYYFTSKGDNAQPYGGK